MVDGWWVARCGGRCAIYHLPVQGRQLRPNACFPLTAGALLVLSLLALPEHEHHELQGDRRLEPNAKRPETISSSRSQGRADRNSSPAAGSSQSFNHDAQDTYTLLGRYTTEIAFHP